MNILNGTAAAKIFEETFGISQNKTIVFNDVLSCGPLKVYEDMHSWQLFREEYWATLDINNKADFNEFERDFYTNFDDFISANEYKLWIGTGLNDQLLLIFIVHLMEIYGLDIKKLLVYQFEKVERTSSYQLDIKGIPLLDQEELTNHPTPYILNDEQLEITRTAWDAVIANTRKNSCNISQTAMMIFFF